MRRQTPIASDTHARSSQRIEDTDKAHRRPAREGTLGVRQSNANTWQGTFPRVNTGVDGFRSVSPVASFKPNRYGLYDVSGNVWEWVSDWYRAHYFAALAAHGVARNPRGPSSSLDPDEPDARKRVIRGGSFLCAENYCARYIVGARMRAEVRSPANHIGFRLVKNAS